MGRFRSVVDGRSRTIRETDSMEFEKMAVKTFSSNTTHCYSTGAPKETSKVSWLPR